jgi:hypothetical protein
MNEAQGQHQCAEYETSCFITSQRTYSVSLSWHAAKYCKVWREKGPRTHGLLWKLKQDSLRCFAMIRTACFILAFACPWCWTTSLPHNALQAKGSGFAAKAMCIQHSTWIPQSCLVLIRSDEEKKQPAHMDSSFHSADSLIQHSSTRYCYLILEPSLLLSEILNLYLLH